MKTQITRINKILFTSLLILSLGYPGTVTFNSNVKVQNLTIETGDKVIVIAGFTVEVMGALAVNGTGELEIRDLATVDVATTATFTDGTLDMDGRSRLMVGGNLSFDSTILQDADGNGIYLDGNLQEVSGDLESGKFDALFCSGGIKTLNMSVAIEDSLVTGTHRFIVSTGKTLTMNAQSVTKVSGGLWTHDGATITLDPASTFLYEGGTNTTMTGVMYGMLEHNGGELNQGGALTVNGTFKNTSGNFVASENISANGIVWTADDLMGSPTQVWDIGPGGITINGGIFKVTTGAFTVEGDWTKVTGGSIELNAPAGSNVVFDGATAQIITSGSSGSNGAFYNVTISNTSVGKVTIADKFEFNVGGTLTIDAGATFATAGFEFDHNNGQIPNSGTFEIHGDETFTTGNLILNGLTKVVDPSGCTLTRTLAGLENVNFESGNTIILDEDMPYISGNIAVAFGTTLDMDEYDLTVANNMTVTNGGTWLAPSTESTFICANNATLAGLAMNFWNFSATTASAVIIFEGGITYTVANDLTLTGGDGTELFLRSNDEQTTAVISNTGLSLAGTQSVDFVRVGKVEGHTDNKITATNSWDIHGNLAHWLFDAMLYTFDTTGDWDDITKWEQARVPNTNDHIEVLTGQTLTLDGNQTIHDVTILGTGIIDVDADDFTVNGDLTVAGTITTSTGLVDVDGIINATLGSITFTGAGELIADSTVTHLGSLSGGAGTVTYNAPFAQTIFAGPYFSIKVSDNTATKTLGGVVTVAGALTIDDNVTTVMADNNLTVAGATTIEGNVTITTAILDANGSFDAENGTITFDPAGHLKLGNTVTHLGDISIGAGTVTYDGDAQNIFADIYYNLIAHPTGTWTKTLGGAVTVNGDLTIGTDITVAIGVNSLDVIGATDINGTVTITSGTLDADGSFDATSGDITFTGAGNLELNGAVEDLGTLSPGAGTVNYDGGSAQEIFGDIYFNLTASGSNTKTLGDDVVVNGALLISSTLAMDTHDLTVTGGADIDGTLTVAANTVTINGASDIDGTINISTGIVDANGTFTADTGDITFTGAGHLRLSGAVADLGTLTATVGTVNYDGDVQTIVLDDYWDLTLSAPGGAAIKTLGGAVTANHHLAIGADATLDVAIGNHAITVKGNFTNAGAFTSQGGTVTFSGDNHQALTSLGSAFNNLVYANTGGSDKNLIISDALDINGDLTVTSGAFNIAGGANVNLAGDLAIANAAVWTKGAGTLTFDGTTQSLTDSNTLPNDLGNISINRP